MISSLSTTYSFALAKKCSSKIHIPFLLLKQFSPHSIILNQCGRERKCYDQLMTFAWKFERDKFMFKKKLYNKFNPT